MQVILKFPSWSDNPFYGQKAVTIEEDIADMWKNGEGESRVRSFIFAVCGNFPEEDMWLPKWRAARIRSMSVGDFVKIENGEWYQCAGTGWVQVTEEEVNRIMALPVYDSFKESRLWGTVPKFNFEKPLTNSNSPFNDTPEEHESFA